MVRMVRDVVPNSIVTELRLGAKTRSDPPALPPALCETLQDRNALRSTLYC